MNEACKDENKWPGINIFLNAMVDKNYIRNLRTPTKEDPLRVLVSACLLGVKCGVDGDNYGEYHSVLKLLDYDNVKFIQFCPEEFVFGTPREMCDIHGGNGLDVLEGRAKVLTSSGKDWTEGMIIASEKMLEIAKKNNVELAIMMDVSAACGSHVIYDGNRYAENKKYQIGMGVCGAQLHRAGFKLFSWREYESLEILYSRLDPTYQIDQTAKDFDQHDWYIDYFENEKEHDNSLNDKDILILPAGQGRTYDCGTMTAIFKADESETSEKYSVSEWWLEPNSDGPGPHSHEENDEVFYVLEGTTSFLVGDKWIDADKGTFLRIPAKTIHDFKNQTDKKTGILNFYIPGGFERDMPAIVRWFEENRND